MANAGLLDTATAIIARPLGIVSGCVTPLSVQHWVVPAVSKTSQWVEIGGCK
jgi:hypothetical protein